MVSAGAPGLYLVNPETGRVELVYADDVADRKGEGWELPKGLKANGDDWNTEAYASQRAAAADQAKVNAKVQVEKDAKKAAELSKSLEANDKAAKDVAHAEAAHKAKK